MKSILVVFLLLLGSCGPRHLAKSAFQHGIKQQQRDIKLLEEIGQRHPQWLSRTDTVTVQVHDTITIEKRVVEYKPQPFRDRKREDFLLDSLLSSLHHTLSGYDKENLKESIRKVFIEVPTWKDFSLDTLGIKIRLAKGVLTVDVSEQKVPYVKEENKTGLQLAAVRDRRWWELWYVWLPWLLFFLLFWFFVRSSRR